MKSIVFLCLVMFSVNASAQWDSLWLNESGRLELEEVVAVDSVGAPQLYLRAKEWVKQRFKDSRDVISDDQPSQNFITINGVYPKEYHYWGFRLSIYCRDGRYKMVFHGLTSNSSAPVRSIPIEEALWGKGMPRYRAKWRDDVLQDINSTATSLKKAMMKPATVEKDW